jgi:RNA recognition motif-containing protein
VLTNKKTKMMKEVEEEEEKLLRTVFVGNLLSTVKKKQIIREFSQFGKVASARLRSVALVDVSSSL